MLGKVNNGRIVYPPVNHGNISNFHMLPEETLRAYGYKDVVTQTDTPVPDTLNVYEPRYIETDTQVVFDRWERVPQTMSSADMIGIFRAAADGGILSDAQLFQSAYLIEDWDGGITSDKAGLIRQWGGKVYKSLHPLLNAAQNLEPGAENGTIWAHVPDPRDEWPEWFLAPGVVDQWMIGSKCTCEGTRYISQIDYNVTTPGTDERWWKEAV